MRPTCKGRTEDASPLKRSDTLKYLARPTLEGELLPRGVRVSQAAVAGARKRHGVCPYPPRIDGEWWSLGSGDQELIVWNEKREEEGSIHHEDGNDGPSPEEVSKNRKESD